SLCLPVRARPDDAESGSGAAEAFRGHRERASARPLPHRHLPGAILTEAPAIVGVRVDGQSGDVPRGATALDAINKAGVYVPQLCKDPDQRARGACRTCLVEIEGMRGFPASCTTPCTVWMQSQRESAPA